MENYTLRKSSLSSSHRQLAGLAFRSHRLKERPVSSPPARFLFFFARKCFASVLLAMIFALASAPFASAAGESRIKKPEFSDRYGSESNVSGSVLVGVALMGNAKADMVLEDILAYLPTAHSYADSKLCVQVMSQDGRYEGHGVVEFVDEAAGGGFEVLGLSGKHSKELLDYPRRAVAVRAEFKAKCNNPAAGVIVPVKMGEDSESTSNLTLLVNAMDGDVEARIATSPKDESPWIACHTPEEATELAFDRICSLPTADHRGKRRTLEIKLIGWSGGETMVRSEIEIPNR